MAHGTPPAVRGGAWHAQEAVVVLVVDAHFIGTLIADAELLPVFHVADAAGVLLRGGKLMVTSRRENWKLDHKTFIFTGRNWWLTL